MGQALSSSEENGTSEYIIMKASELFECFIILVGIGSIRINDRELLCNS